MATVVLVAVMLAGIVALTPLADRWRVPYPVLLTMFGLLVPLVPGVPALRIEPEMILPLVLPPLLFAATQKATARDFRENARPILVLAVGLTTVTAAVVAVVAHADGSGVGTGLRARGGGVAARPGGRDGRGAAAASAGPSGHRPRGRGDVQRRDRPGALQGGRRRRRGRWAVGGVARGVVGARGGGGGRRGPGRRDAGPDRDRPAAPARTRDDDHAGPPVRRVPARRPPAGLGRARGAGDGSVHAVVQPLGADLRRVAAGPGGVAVRRLHHHEPGVRVHRLRADGGAGELAAGRAHDRPRRRRGGHADRGALRLAVPAGGHLAGAPPSSSAGSHAGGRARDRGHRVGRACAAW